MESSYFENTKGQGVLATADQDGRINTAVFGRPHVMEDGTLGFIMPERRTWANLEQSPHASYLFHADESRWDGVRLRLRRSRVEDDPAVIGSLRRRTYSKDDERQLKPLHLVCFEVEEELPLIGPGPSA